MPLSNALLVDHDPKRRQYLSTLLLKAGYSIYQAKDQSQALEKLEKEKVDILIVSSSLPNTNIIELCKEIKSTKEVAIILSFDTHEDAKATFPLLEDLVEGFILDADEDWQIASLLVSIERLKASESKLIATQVQLSAQAQYYSTLFENHPDALYAFDLAGKFTYVNGAAISMSGFSREELLNMSFHSFLTEDQLNITIAYFERAKAGESLSFTSTLVTKPGPRLELNHTLSPIFEREKIIGVYGISKDITTAFRLEKIALIEHSLRELALSGASLEESLLFLLSSFEEISTGMVCLSLCVDQKRKIFMQALAPKLVQDYKSYLYGLEIDSTLSPFGKVVESKEPLSLPHLEGEGEWNEFKERTLTQGMKSLFCYPILSSMGEVKAIFTSFYNKAQQAPLQDVELAQRAVKMIAILIERYQAQKQAQKREQLLAQLNSFVPGALYQFKMDKEGEMSFPYFSDRMGELFGMPLQEVGSNMERLFEQIHPEDRDSFWHSFQVSAQRMQPWLFDYRIIIWESKEIRWLRGHSIPRKEEDGSIVWHGLLIDITDIKKAEETLRIQSRAIEHAAEGIIITSPHLEDNPIIFVNEKFLKDTGYSREEIMGKNCRFLQGEDTDREKVNQMREAIREQKPFIGEVLNYKKDGTPFWSYLVIAPVVDESSRLTHFVGLMNDISLRKEAEGQLLIQNQELKKINAELDRFVYSVSHNLRAPLTSLLGLITISKLTGELYQRDTYLGHMENSIHKLDATIQEINDYAKNVRLDLQVEKLNFHGLIGEVIEGLTFMEEAQRVAIGVDIDPAYDFYTDRSRLQVVLTNLLSNAIKYHDRSKEKPFVQISLQVKATSMHLSVKDNGMGIGEEHQEKIFSMFYRATTASTGSGLGLYIVKENIVKMKGSIKLLSAIKEGSEFIIHLPNLEGER